MHGPNDHHIQLEKGEDGVTRPVLHGGLGADEPSEEMRAGARAAGFKKMQDLKERLEKRGAEQLEKEREIGRREQELVERERAIAERERAVERLLQQSDDTEGTDTE